ncbi:hypothetical protein RUND412_003872 [Rhizina undulata]
MPPIKLLQMPSQGLLSAEDNIQNFEIKMIKYWKAMSMEEATPKLYDKWLQFKLHRFKCKQEKDDRDYYFREKKEEYWHKESLKRMSLLEKRIKLELEMLRQKA